MLELGVGVVGLGFEWSFEFEECEFSVLDCADNVDDLAVLSESSRVSDLDLYEVVAIVVVS